MDILINVNDITAIKIIHGQEQSKYKWLPAIPEKRIFFGLIKSHSSYPEGFYEYGEYEVYGNVGGLVSNDYLNTSPLTINWDEKRVYSMPSIEIRFKNGDHLKKNFNTLSEANLFVSGLEASSRDKFERVEV